MPQKSKTQNSAHKCVTSINQHNNYCWVSLSFYSMFSKCFSAYAAFHCQFRIMFQVFSSHMWLFYIGHHFAQYELLLRSGLWFISKVEHYPKRWRAGTSHESLYWALWKTLYVTSLIVFPSWINIWMKVTYVRDGSGKPIMDALLSQLFLCMTGV